MDIWGLLERARWLHPGQLAVVDGNRSCDYATLHARARAVATSLRRQGIARGERLAVLAWNGQEFLESTFAAARLGSILCPLNVRLSPPELAQILNDAGARWLIADASFAGVVSAVQALGTPLAGISWTGSGDGPDLGLVSVPYEALALPGAEDADPEPVRPEDVAHIYYTSGTTGVPKGVMLTQRNVVLHALGTIAELGLDDADRWAHIAPMYHLADAWASIAVTWVGGAHVMLPRFEAEAALDLLERERITRTNLVPSMLNLMVRHPGAADRDWSALRMLLSGGAPIAPEVVRTVLAVFRCAYVQTYGMTETSPFLTMSLPKRRFASWPEAEQVRMRSKTGRPFVAVELRIVDEHGAPVPADERTVGEIQVRGETVTPGYWNRPGETRAAFVDGWFKTGDLAVWDAEGFVTIVDRKKDMILTGGENVYSTEVENVLYAHPAVLEAAVYGVADELWGERVQAAVVRRPGAEVAASELDRHCRAHLAGYKVPKRFDLVETLPRTGTGKVAKRLLREASRERARTEPGGA